MRILQHRVFAEWFEIKRYEAPGIGHYQDLG